MRLKQFALGTFLCISAIACSVSHADTLKLVGAQTDILSPADIYPYSFNINGSTSTVSMMCIDYGREVSIGESWQANAISVPLDNSTLSQDYRADAWIFSQIGQTDPFGFTYTNAEIQYAVWDILDPSAISNNPEFKYTWAKDLASQAMLEANNPLLIASGFYSNFDFYIPTDDETGWGTNGIPQRYIVDKSAITPEPSSVLLMGTGLIGAGVLLLRRRMSMLPSTL